MTLANDIIESADLSIFGIAELRDGLTLEEIKKKWKWVIEGGISSAILGKKGNKLIWYDGTWVMGQYFEDTTVWKGGQWFGGLDSKGKVHTRGNTPNEW